MTRAFGEHIVNARTAMLKIAEIFFIVVPFLSGSATVAPIANHSNRVARKLGPLTDSSLGKEQPSYLIGCYVVDRQGMNPGLLEMYCQNATGVVPLPHAYQDSRPSLLWPSSSDCGLCDPCKGSKEDGGDSCM